MVPATVLAPAGYSALEYLLKNNLKFNIAQGLFLSGVLRCCHPFLESESMNTVRQLVASGAEMRPLPC